MNNGSATFAAATLASGTHSITAVYGGDAHFLSSTSGPLSQVVQKATPAIALASGLNPSVTGQLVTFTATVTGSAATSTGAVTFTSGGMTLGNATLSGGVGTITAPLTGTGTGQTISAQYNGDRNYAPGSVTLSQTVNAAGTSLALSASSNPALTGSAATFTAAVAVASPGQGTPTGTVTFSDGATQLGASTLAGGVATGTAVRWARRRLHPGWPRSA